MIESTVILINSDNKNFFLSGNVTNNSYFVLPSLSIKTGIEYVASLSYLNSFDLILVAKLLL